MIRFRNSHPLTALYLSDVNPEANKERFEKIERETEEKVSDSFVDFVIIAYLCTIKRKKNDYGN